MRWHARAKGLVRGSSELIDVISTMEFVLIVFINWRDIMKNLNRCNTPQGTGLRAALLPLICAAGLMLPLTVHAGPGDGTAGGICKNYPDKGSRTIVNTCPTDISKCGQSAVKGKLLGGASAKCTKDGIANKGTLYQVCKIIVSYDNNNKQTQKCERSVTNYYKE